MHRILAAVLVLLALVVVGAGPAAAQDVDAILDELDLRGYAIEPGATASFDELEGLGLGAGSDTYAVILAADPPGGTDRLADELRQGFVEEVTVLVIGSSELGAVSDIDGVDAGAAADAAQEVLVDGGTRGEAVAAFVDAVGVGGSGGGGSGVESSDGGGSGLGLLVVLLIIGALLVGGFLWLRSRAKGKDASDVVRARAEIKAQLAAVATEIVQDEDQIRVSGNEEAIAHYRAANETYTRVSDLVDQTENLTELAELSDELDRARWQLDTAEALVEGRPVGPEPQPDAPVACFFDPTHRPGTSEATLKTTAGDKQVRVCRSCAEKLERGEQPEPRMIDVGGRRVPAAKAPRSHGGLGMGGLGVFEILLGAIGAGRAMKGRSGGLGLDWSGRSASRTSSSRRRSSSGGVFGPDRLPPRPPGLPRTSPTRSRSSSRRGSGASKGRAKSRARRSF